MQITKRIVRLIIPVVFTSVANQIPVFAQGGEDPELLTKEVVNAQVKAERFLVSTADSYATQAGVDILKAGGSAVDAAITVQLVLTLVEPQSSGIGGGAFLLHHDGASGTVTSYDGREWAPKAATPELFLDEAGKFIGWRKALTGGRSTGVPGVLRLLEMAHAKHGKLPWAQLFEPAITLAEEGFAVSERMSTTLGRMKRFLAQSEDMAGYFFHEDGTTLQPGEILKNPAYAQTLRLLAQGGADAFYTGSIAEAIVTRIGEAIEASDHPRYDGMSLQDLSDYKAVERPAVCSTYRVYKVCGMGPPSSGGVTTLQILGQLEPYDLATMGPESPVAVHLFAEASRRAFADRNLYLADPDHVDMPLPGMLDRSYLLSRSATISLNEVGKQEIEAGQPAWPESIRQAADGEEKGTDTTHFSILDEDGNAVSMTSSVETIFGSTLMAAGFILNNQLTDFSFYPERDGKPIANAAGSRKRPRSSMSPTIIYGPDDKLRMVIGSPGGSSIIGFVSKTIVAHLDWGLDIQQAIDYPHVINQNGATRIENKAPVAGMADQLSQMGHEVKQERIASGLHGIAILPGGIYGGADSRRGGLALGE